MYSSELKAFIRSKNNLFWYTPDKKKEEISPELLVESVLNFGSLDEIRSLISLMGRDEVSRIFLGCTGRKKMNYYPEIYNFFSLVFSKYA